MEKEELKMKSIFNVYRGAELKSLESAETILNKLIFNEKTFLCEGEAVWGLAKGKTNSKPFQTIAGLQNGFTSKAAPRPRALPGHAL